MSRCPSVRQKSSLFCKRKIEQIVKASLVVPFLRTIRLPTVYQDYVLHVLSGLTYAYGSEGGGFVLIEGVAGCCSLYLESVRCVKWSRDLPSKAHRESLLQYMLYFQRLSKITIPFGMPLSIGVIIQSMIHFASFRIKENKKWPRNQRV